jgi:hypothetical protein
VKFAAIDKHFLQVTGKASEVVRQLAYAGFAVIWVFSATGPANTGGERFLVPVQLIPAAILFGVALLVDALQYMIQAVRWTVLHSAADKATKTVDDEYPVPDDIDIWPQRLFFTKGAVVVVGYVAYVAALGGILGSR